MKLQQLRYLCEVASQGLNLSKAAKTLHTSQPGISKQISLLEDELGVDIFVRNGKRVVKVTPPGQVIIEIAERMLRDAKNLKLVGQEFTNEASGCAMYALASGVPARKSTDAVSCSVGPGTVKLGASCVAKFPSWSTDDTTK